MSNLQKKNHKPLKNKNQVLFISSRKYYQEIFFPHLTLLKAVIFLTSGAVKRERASQR
jgi:hypothetical protein